MRPLRRTTSRAIALAALSALLLVSACDRPQPSGGDATPASAAPAQEPPAKPPAPAATVHATFKQTSGAIKVRLATAEAPRLCMAFILLAERGYFTGRRWSDFSPVVRQLGDSPPLFSVAREFSPKLLFNEGGLLCASNTSEASDARAKPNRIFLTVKEQDRWNLQYVVFGKIEAGLPVAQSLSDGETVSEIVIEGDTAALRARFAKDIAEWSKAIDSAGKPR